MLYLQLYTADIFDFSSINQSNRASKTISLCCRFDTVMLGSVTALREAPELMALLAGIATGNPANTARFPTMPDLALTGGCC